jgi:hypothetical protein
MNKDSQLLAEICYNYGCKNENHLYQYMVESYFNGHPNQAKDILWELRKITTMHYNYIERFRENLDIWFEPATSKILKNFFKINQ